MTSKLLLTQILYNRRLFSLAFNIISSSILCYYFKHLCYAIHSYERWSFYLWAGHFKFLSAEGRCGAPSSKRIQQMLQRERVRSYSVVCPNFAHPALSTSFKTDSPFTTVAKLCFIRKNLYLGRLSEVRAGYPSLWWNFHPARNISHFYLDFNALGLCGQYPSPHE